MSEDTDGAAPERSDDEIRVRYRPGPGDPPFLPMHGRIFLPGEEVTMPAHTEVERGGGIVDLRAWFEGRADFEVLE
ncbi:hypothetical protein [Methylorubrum populi]|uniref:hypothetical protein n=1 Tax=Methylorubrum populi TaxID=223967 RepID=UPI000DB4EBDF|nr:hypothetical protein [Methylorubrum populi]PZP66243.1 MAG: hypothetical protein DI590_24635 [Methylorubrum populi]